MFIEYKNTLINIGATTKIKFGEEFKITFQFQNYEFEMQFKDQQEQMLAYSEMIKMMKKNYLNIRAILEETEKNILEDSSEKSE